MFEVRFTPQAMADLEAIKRYLSEDLLNPQAAAELIGLVFARLQTLVSMPRTGAQLRTNIPMLKGYRFIPCKNYLVFYRIDASRVSVIRVLYARSDYLALLEPAQEADDGG